VIFCGLQHAHFYKLPETQTVCYRCHGSYGQGKLGNFKQVREKSANFTFQSQVNIRRSGKVRENQSTRVQKLTKMQKKFELFYADCVQQFTNVYLLASLAGYLYLHF